MSCIPDSKAQDSGFHEKKNFPESGIQISSTYSKRRGGACRKRPSFPFFYDLWQCVEFHWLQAPLGVSLSVCFLFLPSCARVLEISPFALIKPDACYAGYNNLTAESGNSVTNCILMSDPLVLFLNKNQRTSCIHKSTSFEQDIKNHNFQPRMRIKGEDYQPFLSIFVFLDAKLAFEKLQMQLVGQLPFPTAPVCQEKKCS